MIVFFTVLIFAIGVLVFLLLLTVCAVSLYELIKLIIKPNKKKKIKTSRTAGRKTRPVNSAGQSTALLKRESCVRVADEAPKQWSDIAVGVRLT